jgi:hypothetical protein
MTPHTYLVERRQGQGDRGINGRGPRSGRATVYAAKALDADEASTLRGLWVGALKAPTPATRRARGSGQGPVSGGLVKGSL